MSLYRDIELPLAAVLADMEEAGFLVDRDGLAEYGKVLMQQADLLAQRIYFLAGEEFNINSPKQLGEILFEKLGLPAGKKTKTGYSTNAEILEKLASKHPIVSDILDYRQLTKLIGTYVTGLLKVADEDGRIHTTFKQTGTATGRLSSAEPNLQNIPVKTDAGRELRKFFLPREGYKLISADYSQIELRILACISGDERMMNAFIDGTDIHTSTASAVFGVSEDEVTPLLRKRAKAVNFGIVYGIGEYSLSQDLDITVKQAKEYIDSYLNSYPAVSAYLQNIVSIAKSQGYVDTLYGRKRYIPEISQGNAIMRKFGERVAMNSPIQGTAADIIKIAMLNVSQRLKDEGLDARMILQVHDELIVEASAQCADMAALILREEMEHAVSLPVPLTVDLSVGERWYET
jgi:DNA polymerase-1